MIKFSVLFKKIALLALVAALLLAAMPMTNVYASSLTAPTDPPTDGVHNSDERLEKIWVRMQKAYDRQGQMSDHAGEWIGKIQGLIDKLEENGKDVAALQAALDAFGQALKEAHPIYESAKGILNSHKGFDADGKVTDSAQALETVKELGAKLKEIREITGTPGKALRELIKTYRDEHRPTDAASPQG